VTTEHNRGVPSELLERLEVAASGAHDFHAIASGLRVTDEERPFAPGHLQAAFEYAEAPPGPESIGVGLFFLPMMEFDGRRYPPGLEALPDDFASTWQAAADAAKAPLAAARLNDLCFEAGLGARGRRARSAGTAYLEASKALATPIESEKDDRRTHTRLCGLSRARQLARRVGGSELEQPAVEAILATAEDLIDAGDPRYAVLFLDLLSNDAQLAADVRTLLDRVRSDLAEDPIGREEALLVQLKFSGLDETARQGLRRELVRAIAAQADAVEGIARAHHLERAISEAWNAGLQDMAEELTVRIQELSASGELDLSAHEFGFTIQRDEVERWFNLFLSAPDWQQALLRLVIAPPSGKFDENRLEAEAEARDNPIRWLVTNVVVGGDGLPRFTPADDDELAAYRLTSYEMRKAQLHGAFLPELFNRIWKKWGPLTADELAVFFAGSTHVEDVLAKALGRDLHRLFVVDYEGALYTGAAHIEALARSLVLALARPAYRAQRTNAPGQYIGLGALLSVLGVAGLDESWIRFLHGLLSSPMGLNYRNELLHGFEPEPSETNAALLYVGILYLARGISISAPGAELDAEDPPG
jgi:hypothetical protein